MFNISLSEFELRYFAHKKYWQFCRSIFNRLRCEILNMPSAQFKKSHPLYL